LVEKKKHISQSPVGTTGAKKTQVKINSEMWLKSATPVKMN